MEISTSTRPEWAAKIEELRDILGLSQAALAKKLNVSAMAPSRWERGINRPPSSIYLRLGKMIGHPLCWYFWEQAGLKKEDLLKCTDPREIPSIDANYVALPLLPSDIKLILDNGAVHGATDVLLARRDWCPNPEQTICWEYSGNGMDPILIDSAIVAVDMKERTPDKLIGKMVLATHPRHGNKVKWLHQGEKGLELKPENSKAHTFSMMKDEWKIAGEVIWWFRKK